MDPPFPEGIQQMEPTRFDLSGKTALVTGAGRGIGRACALALAANGANVSLTARTTSQLEEVKAEIEKMGRRAIVVPADVTKRAEVQNVVDRTLSELGGLDILVNNAGIYTMKPLVQDPTWTSGYSKFVPNFDTPFTEEDWDALMDINVKGVFLFTQAVGPHMMAQRKGKIINISSIDAEHGLKYAAAYCATKGAVKAFTKGLAREWVRYNINVNCVGPGYTETPLFPWVYDDPERSKIAAKNNVPMGRFAKPEEIATPVIYLASDLSDYVTGESIYIDGGVLA